MTQTQIHPKTSAGNLSEDVIRQVELYYKVKYVGVFCLGKDSQWDNAPVDIFYQPKPNIELGHTNYMAVFYRNGTLYVADGSSAIVGVTFNAVVAENGEIIYSCYRHDYQLSSDGTAWIDGGRDYTRQGGSEMITFVVIDGEFYKVEG